MFRSSRYFSLTPTKICRSVVASTWRPMEGYFFHQFFMYSKEFRPWLPSQVGNESVQPETFVAPDRNLLSRPKFYLLSRWPVSDAQAGSVAAPSIGREPDCVQNWTHFEPRPYCNEYVRHPGSVSRFTVGARRSVAPFQVSPKKNICNFCRENGDRREFYTEHELKDVDGNIICPVLRRHKCEVCGATGSRAHTKSYCPVLKKVGIQSRNAVSLKRTLHDSCGRVRK